MSTPESPGSGADPRSSAEAPRPSKEVRSIGATQGKNRDKCHLFLQAFCEHLLSQPPKLAETVRRPQALWQHDNSEIALMVQHMPGAASEGGFELPQNIDPQHPLLLGDKLDGKAGILFRLAEKGTNAAAIWEEHKVMFRYIECVKSDINTSGEHELVYDLLEYTDSPSGPKHDSRMESENSYFPVLKF
ncbi:hypothetical protein BU24DRAFT_415289 [Aaosphaeria arxii CBS 175.79]|uniref:Uncharacterized protein n=1 Tax=Aaosphaeria arxii CBS 175.79 TaxID=1450172 RepID=A0A6A5X7D6_9PLEO|nr:uncharacterized protein BU24DRAFT_415289 [Aaosphaeria arxii CBS 175.79]KAF2008925.1 hypothetical protein BU24DRAFT_415289 [Aaosphaeria arxii CBS 175.79]